MVCHASARGLIRGAMLALALIPSDTIGMADAVAADAKPSIEERLEKLDKDVAALRGVPVVGMDKRCQLRLAVFAAINQYAYGKGSLAKCQDGEVATGGACHVNASSCATNSRFVANAGGAPSGFECIIGPSSCGDTVRAEVMCCR